MAKSSHNNLPMVPTGARFLSTPLFKRKYETPGAMRTVCEAYFDLCDRNEKPYTMAGLSLALGITPNKITWNTQQGNAYSEVLLWAKGVIVDQVEARVIEGQANPYGLVMWLKNHAGYQDKVSVEQTNPVTELTDEELDRKLNRLLTEKTERNESETEKSVDENCIDLVAIEINSEAIIR